LYRSSTDIAHESGRYDASIARIAGYLTSLFRCFERAKYPTKWTSKLHGQQMYLQRKFLPEGTREAPLQLLPARLQHSRYPGLDAEQYRNRILDREMPFWRLLSDCACGAGDRPVTEACEWLVALGGLIGARRVLHCRGLIGLVAAVKLLQVSTQPHHRISV
jgi:hypothetical protein